MSDTPDRLAEIRERAEALVWGGTTDLSGDGRKDADRLILDDVPFLLDRLAECREALRARHSLPPFYWSGLPDEERQKERIDEVMRKTDAALASSPSERPTTFPFREWEIEEPS